MFYRGAPCVGTALSRNPFPRAYLAVDSTCHPPAPFESRVRVGLGTQVSSSYVRLIICSCWRPLWGILIKDVVSALLCGRLSRGYCFIVTVEADWEYYGRLGHTSHWIMSPESRLSLQGHRMVPLWLEVGYTGARLPPPPAPVGRLVAAELLLRSSTCSLYSSLYPPPPA
eukprot:1194788-Prorocentrum_minimum.AAC.3